MVASALAIGFALWDWNWLRQPVARWIMAETGRHFAIRGDLDVDFSARPLITAHDVVFGNAEWGSQPNMAHTKSVVLRWDIWEFFKGQNVVHELRLIEPRLLLEKSRDGKRNWDIRRKPPRRPLRLASLDVRGGRIYLVDPVAGTRADFAVNTQRGSANRVLTVDGNGRFKNQLFSLRGQGGTILSLHDARIAYPVAVAVRIGATSGQATGTLRDPIRLQGIDVKLDMRGPDLAKLYPIFGLSLPSTPPYTLTGRLLRRGKVWAYNGFEGRVGDSDVTGDVSVDTSRARKYLRANLISKRLDFDDLAGFVGAPPSTGPGETASPEQRAENAARKRAGRVLPEQRYKLERLNAMDADVQFRGESVLAAKIPLDQLNARLLLNNGRLTLAPLTFGIAKGRINAKVILDGRASPITSSVELNAQRLDLKQLFRNSKFAAESAGQIGGYAKLSGYGNSIADMLGSSNGSLGVAMSAGQVSNLMMEYLGLDLAEALKFKLIGDREIQVRCGVADFAVKQGIMQTRLLVLDTSDTNVTGKGQIDLDKERIAMELLAHPKDMSILSARVPIRLSGSFSDLSATPDGHALIAKGAVAIALGTLLSPLAALVPLVEMGGGKDSDCKELLSSVPAIGKT